MGNNTPHTCIPGLVWQKKHVDFHNLSSKSANSDFPFTLYALARHYTTGGYATAIFPLGEYGPFGFVCQWWLLFSFFQCGYVAFDVFFPFPKSNSASQYANDDWQRPTSIVDLTAREPCRIFTFAKHVSFEHSTGIPCPVISSRRDGNINKRTKLKSFLTLDRRSVSPHRPACVRAFRGQWAIWLAPRLSLATESTGTVLIPSQMSEIADHDPPSLAYWLFASPQLISVRWCCRGRAKRENGTLLKL